MAQGEKEAVDFAERAARLRALAYVAGNTLESCEWRGKRGLPDAA